MHGPVKAPLKIALCVFFLGVVITLGTFAVARHLLTNSFRGRFAADVFTRARLVQEKLEEAVLVAEAASSFEEATAGFATRPSPCSPAGLSRITPG